MGGEGSGRHADPLKALWASQKQPEYQQDGFTHFSPLTQVQAEALKTSPPLVTGVSSVFTRTGDVVSATNDYTWAQIDKTTSDIANITTKSHTSLTDIGTNTHATIDTHLANNNIHVPSMTAGSVTFHNGTILSQDNANLFWDDTNNRLGIGTATPTYPLDILRDAADGNTRMRLRNTTAGTTSQVLWVAQSDGSTSANLGKTSSTYTPQGNLFPDCAYVQGNGCDLTIRSTSGVVRLGAGTSNTDIMLSGGFVGINTSMPNAKLHVFGSGDGTTIFGSGATSLSGGMVLTTWSNALSGGIAFGSPSIAPNDPCIITSTNTSSGRIFQRQITTNNVYIGDIDTSAGSMILRTNGDDRMRITTSGAINIYPELTPSAVVLTGSGAIFVSGGELWYKGYAGTYTNLAVS